jgi:hypothetical protein
VTKIAGYPPWFYPLSVHESTSLLLVLYPAFSTSREHCLNILYRRAALRPKGCRVCFSEGGRIQIVEASAADNLEVAERRCQIL